jgi:hypothetical protein
MGEEMSKSDVFFYPPDDTANWLLMRISTDNERHLLFCMLAPK